MKMTIFGMNMLFLQLKKLNSLHLEGRIKDSLFSDIDADLFNCYLNNKYKKNHPIWNMIEDAYFKGFWPCGWEGKYPKGSLSFLN